MAFQNLLGNISCDIKALSERTKKLILDFSEDIEDTIIDLTSRSYGSFLVTFLALISQVIVTTSYNYVSFLITAVVGNIVATVYSTVALGLTLINGVGIMLKYLAASALKISLQRRIRFTNQLLIEIDGFIRSLNLLRNIKTSSTNLFKEDIRQALAFIKRAEFLVGLESTKISNGGGVNRNNLNSAIDQIDRGLIALAGLETVSSPLIASLRAIEVKYQYTVISADPFELTAANPLNIADYFKEANRNIVSRYTLEDGSISQQGQKVLLNFLLEFLAQPEISQYMREVSAGLLLSDRIESLGTRLPINAIISRRLIQTGVTSLLDKIGSSALNDVADLADGAENFVSGARDVLRDAFETIGINTNEFRGNFENETDNLSNVSIPTEVSQLSVLSQDV